MGYEAVVFDLDGVVVRPTPAAVLRRAAERTFESFGVDAPDGGPEAVAEGRPDGVWAACERCGVEPSAFWAACEERAATAQRAAVAAGEKPCYDDVDDLSDFDRPLGLVSNNQHATVEGVLDALDLADLFATAYGREPSFRGLYRKKPSSHYLGRALSDLDVAATDALYVGDGNDDLLAGRAAGTDVAFVRRSHRADYDLVAEPTHVVASLGEVCALVRE